MSTIPTKLSALKKLIQLVSKTCHITERQASNTIQLLDDGNTVPFIARYRKHITDSLDDTQLRLLKEKLDYFRTLIDRKKSILVAIDEQGKLTDELLIYIESIEDKAILEQCYSPFKSTRVSKVSKAHSAGLQSLADKLWLKPTLCPNKMSLQYINASKGFNSTADVLEGTLTLALDSLSKDVTLIAGLTRHILSRGFITSSAVKSKINEAINFKDYFNFNSRINKLPAHRVLAMLRGKAEGYLRLKINEEPSKKHGVNYSYCQTLIAKHLKIYLSNNDHDSWHRFVIDKAWRTKLLPNIEKQVFKIIKDKADQDAIEQFANNMYSLLMAAPVGEKVTLGIDPGFKSGCKLAVVDQVGKLVDFATIYPHQPQLQDKAATAIVLKLLTQYNVEFIAIGNGTASRESEQFIHTLLIDQFSTIQTVSVSEAGASVYSASELASIEFPALDVTFRGAVSIARRLQDPLSELVKVEAKAIGVGLYQHDVHQIRLENRLNMVVEECVNKVGVDLNTASAHLLAHVSGLNFNVANNIVHYREKYGRFMSRESLNNVPKLGKKTFQQAAGFLTVTQGDNCLDETILHPEQYLLANNIIKNNGLTVESVVFSKKLHHLKIPNVPVFTKGQAQLQSTYQEILNILNMKRRDPRENFKGAKFNKAIKNIFDLEIEMTVQGQVSNVANFGVFVDIGIHQDGLVHISMLNEDFVTDPNLIVKVGQIVNVKVVDIDVLRKRISLSMKSIQQPVE